MSRKLKTYKDFNYGTGVGKLDSKVHGISDTEDVDYTRDEFIGSGIPDTSIEMEIDRRVGAYPIVSPGYAYIGDREIYIYGRKATQVSYPISSSGSQDDPYDSGVVYIPLLDVPDGSTIFHLPTPAQPYGSILEGSGPAPINVGAFSSGELDEALTETVYTQVPGYEITLYYTDWYLPSIDELYLMATMYDSHGGSEAYGFGDDEYYWSSTEVSGVLSPTHALSIIFNYGITPEIAETEKIEEYRVRAIRMFYDPNPHFVGDLTGEGYVFYSSGDIHWECATVDQSEGHAWSNVIDSPLGSTEEDLGTGQANTIAIINQTAFDDWYLPSKDELNLIYGELVVSGGIVFGE